ncbi:MULTISPECIES: amino acid adenylation domain-containing protein [unclassified Micromonospora]|uniref:amino acid adenylation domain-containing protein n=1 Tax=Micromonospora sp. NPDC005206 TaxID=3157022 RepID=UPI0033B62121
MTGTLLTRLLTAGRRRPEAIAVHADDGRVSWGRLLDLAGRYAASYRAYGVGPGHRVGVLLEPGPHAVAAAVGAFAVRAAYVPLDPAQPPARIGTLVDVADPLLVVAESAVPGRPVLRPAAVVGRPGLPLADIGAPSDVAYVVHTSGSTGVPKAVQVEHANLTNLLVDLDERAPVPAGHTGTWWTRPSFDVAIWECLAPLSRGGTVRVVPAAARHDGAALAAFLDVCGAQSAYVPPAFLPELHALLRAESGALSGLRRLLVGVEPIPRSLLEAIARSRPNLTVVNGYGPAETTVCCTLYVLPHHGATPGERTPIGTPVRGTTLLLRHADGSYHRTGTGELVVAGAAVARGYLRAPAGAPAFIADPTQLDRRAYRTGDLVRTLPDGNLLFLGRADRQVKIRGFRIEPAEVEAVLRGLPGVRDVVVAARRLSGAGDVLVAYLAVEPGSGITERAARGYAAERLPAYAVPAAVLLLSRLPLTPHGKYDHDQLAAQPLPAGVPGPGAPANLSDDPLDTGRRSGSLELVLATWRRLLPVRDVRAGDSFVALGGTSLAAARAAAWLSERTGVPVSAGDVLRADDAATLAQRLAGPAGPDPVPVGGAGPVTAGGRGPVGARQAPLTPEQLGVWLHDELHPGSTLYSEPVRFGTDAPVDLPRLVDALRRALAGHPAFGAGLRLVDGLPELVLDRHRPEVRVRRFADPAELDAAVRAHAERPFDTTAEPLLRCAVLTTGRRTEVLLVWHHLVVDAWSLRLLLADVTRCHADPAWSPPVSATTVCDLGLRRSAWVAGEAGQAAVAAAVARVRDVPEPAPAAHAGRTVLTRPVRASAAALSRPGGGTATELVAAAYARALGGLLDRDTVLIGCASDTRRAADEFDVAGYAVNTVLLRCDDVRAGDWADLVDRVGGHLRRVAAEQAPFAGVAREVRRGTGAPPGTYPTCYLDSVEEPELVTGAVRWQRRELHRAANRFPLCLTLRHAASGALSILVEADGGLLDRPAVTALATAVTDQLEAYAQGDPDGTDDRVAAGRRRTGRVPADD